MSKQTFGRVRTQPFWLRSTANRMHCMTVLFVRSLDPSVSGWYALDIFRLTLVSLCKAFQKRDRKSLSRSETISSGNPFSQYHSLKNICASSSAVRVVLVGIMRMSEPDLSVKV